MRSYKMDPSNTILPQTCGKLVTEVSLSTRRYQVASITQNNHVYKDLVKYFRSEVSLNLRSQVNIQNALNNISNCLPLNKQTYEILQNQKSCLPLIYNTSLILPTMALTYPKKYKKDINPEIQNRAITNFITAKQQDLNGFLVHHIEHYKDSKYNNTALQYYIKEDFIRWIKETQVPINKDIIRDFYNFLQEYRVFVPMDRGSIRDNIQEHVINIKEEHKWTL